MSFRQIGYAALWGLPFSAAQMIIMRADLAQHLTRLPWNMAGGYFLGALSAWPIFFVVALLIFHSIRFVVERILDHER